ncbi:MCE family protein [Tomitella biformata]|uniref:MCE family protein n=1 Tax=Tomitella biformata TaxID=630403 RepID=UPI0004664406|nr:MCE family protein [Tomitella biformata]
MTVRRSPVITGIIGIVMVLLATAAGFSFSKLPFFGAGTTYTAEFSEAAGLKSGNEVRVAGVKVGQVTGVELDGNKVLVSYRVSDTWIGDKTRAGIEIKTLLGSKYLSLDPQGSQLADPDEVIPLERTSSPYDVIEAFSDAAQSLEEVDTAQLAQSMQVLSDAFAGTPESIRGALDGVTRLSQTISTRDDAVRKLFAETKETSKIVADRDQEFQQLIARSGELLAELNGRRTAIHQLLVQSQEVSRQLSGLVADNEQQIGPALTQLQTFVDLLVKNQDNLDKAMVQGAQFYNLFNNSLGNGRWWDTSVGNILPPGIPELPSDRGPMLNIDGAGN